MSLAGLTRAALIAWALNSLLGAQFAVLSAPLGSGTIGFGAVWSVRGGLHIRPGANHDFVVAWSHCCGQGSFLEARSGADGAVLWTLPLPTAGSQPTMTFDRAADFDGDGFVDVVSGLNTGDVIVVSGLTGAVMHTFPAAAYSASPAGAVVDDVNGDLVPDLLVGGNVGNGVVFNVLSGSNGALLGALAPPTPSFGFTEIASLGDVNGDGQPDVAIGDYSSAGQAGVVYVRSVVGGSVIRTHYGTALNEGYGSRVVNAGDIDGDGVQDYAVGIPGADPNGVQNAGQVRLYSGSTGLLLSVANGPAPGTGNFGYFVSKIGDYNADGMPDFAVQTGGTIAVFSGAGGLIASLQGSDGYSIVQFTGRGDVGCRGPERRRSFGAARHFVHQLESYVRGQGILLRRHPTGLDGVRQRLRGACRCADPPLRRRDSDRSRRIPLRIRAHACAAELPVVLFSGYSMTSWNGIALPWMPAPVTMPGCSVYVAPDVLFTTTTSSFGRAFFPLPVPPGFSGYFTQFQAYVPNTGATIMPGALTGALQVLVL